MTPAIDIRGIEVAQLGPATAKGMPIELYVRLSLGASVLRSLLLALQAELAPEDDPYDDDDEELVDDEPDNEDGVEDEHAERSFEFTMPPFASFPKGGL